MPHLCQHKKLTTSHASYDAWGKQTITKKAPFPFYRGYTGHEHLPEFGLINMNGRMYDPAVARFLSPDPYVQAPDLSQNFNRYSYCLNNPLIYTDPSGEFWHIVIGAAVGGVINWATNGADFSSKGLGYFGVGALAGGVGAGIGTGVNVSLAGGSFSSGFMFGSSGVSSIGAFSGFLTGASSGFSGAFLSSIGNGLLNGDNFGSSFKDGLVQGGINGLIGGTINGISSGVASYNKGLNFFTGKGTFDVSQAAASCIPPGLKNVTGKYVGQYLNEVDVYETAELGIGKNSGGVTLPGIGIIVGQGVHSKGANLDLMKHEFGHVLQYRLIKSNAYYRVIGTSSLASASLHGVDGHSHNKFWTETWANYLSQQYHGGAWNTIDFPIKNINPVLFEIIKYSTSIPFLNGTPVSLPSFK